MVVSELWWWIFVLHFFILFFSMLIGIMSFDSGASPPWISADIGGVDITGTIQ